MKSSPTKSDLQVKSEIFDPREVFQIIEDAFSPQALAKNVKLMINRTTIHSNVRDPNLPMLQGDKRRLLQVLISLVKNAIRQCKMGLITIDAVYLLNQSMLQVTIEDIGCDDDSGVAIEVDNSKLLRTPFANIRINAENTDIDSGRTVVLSLTLVRQIVEAFNGALHITKHGSQKANTVCFTMKLPVSMMSPNFSSFDPRGLQLAA